MEQLLKQGGGVCKYEAHYEIPGNTGFKLSFSSFLLIVMLENVCDTTSHL